MIFQVFTLQEFSRVMLLQVGLGAKNPRGITLMLACVSARNYIFRKMKNLISLAIDQEFGRLSTICQITFTLANFNLLVLFVFFFFLFRNSLSGQLWKVRKIWKVIHSVVLRQVHWERWCSSCSYTVSLPTLTFCQYRVQTRFDVLLLN